MAWFYDYGSGTPSLDAGDLTIWDGLGELSVHCWCYLRSNYYTGDHTAFTHYDGTNGFRLYFDETAVNGKIKCPKMLVVIGGTSCRAEPSSDNLFTNSVWHQFGGSWKKNTATNGIKAVLDGVVVAQAATTSHTGDFPSLTCSTYVGRSTGSSVCWDGYIGEVAAWNGELSDDEWAALGAGVPAWAVRPGGLILYSPMRKPASNEFYLLPQAGTTGDFTHTGVTYQESDHPMADIQGEDPWLQHPGPTGTQWSGFTRVADDVLVSAYRDSSVVNGKTYKYKVKAVDTSQNEGPFSAESATVTPTAGIGGAPRVPFLRNYRNRRGTIRRARGTLPGTWRDI